MLLTTSCILPLRRKRMPYFSPETRVIDRHVIQRILNRRSLLQTAYSINMAILQALPQLATSPASNVSSYSPTDTASSTVRATDRQGLRLVPFSTQRKHCLRDTLGALGGVSDKNGLR